MKVTKHADTRAKERLGFHHKALEHTLSKVLEFGICHAQVKGKIKRFFDKLFLEGGEIANNIRLYGEFVYILRDEVLITILHLPNEYRNYKKYLK